MYVGCKVKTTPGYKETMHGKELKGKITEISSTDPSIVKVLDDAGRGGTLNKHWLMLDLPCCCRCCCCHCCCRQS